MRDQQRPDATAQRLAADLAIEGLDSADIARNMTKIPLEQSGPRRSYTGAQSGQGPR